jgi:hypothetical protein
MLRFKVYQAGNIFLSQFSPKRNVGFTQNATFSEIGIFPHCCVEAGSPSMSDHFPHSASCTEMRGKTGLVFFTRILQKIIHSSKNFMAEGSD